jgi:hypothetical protein
MTGQELDFYVGVGVIVFTALWSIAFIVCAAVIGF